MPAIVPSYLAKTHRAKKHLVELEAEVQRYVGRHPHAVREGMEGKRNVRRLVFREDPANTDIPVIAADVIYNLRSALDHLMGALVANSERQRVYFPIYFQGVWEDAFPGEDKQRVKKRCRWRRDTRTVSDGALAVLKGLQPLDDADDRDDASALQSLNRLSTRDRHEKLPVIVTALLQPSIRYTLDGEDITSAISAKPPAIGLHDGAEITKIPEDAVDVQIEGAPLIAIDVGKPTSKAPVRWLELLPTLGSIYAKVWTEVIPALASYVRS